jgi:DNA modification methylase
VRAEVIRGDALTVLGQMPDGVARTCVTSPPYFGLRDYGAEGQIGLEKTPEEYAARLVEVFREVRRVLTSDGTLWLNLGDSYAANRSYQVSQTKHPSLDYGPANATKARAWRATPEGLDSGLEGGKATYQRQNRNGSPCAPGYKPKDLIGVPWLVAFALRADGWYLRSEIIWHKPNPMPESVRDRPTKAHEQIFLLSKSANYFYDAEAIKEPLAISNAQRTTAHYNTAARYGADNGGNGGLDALASRMRSGVHDNRNRRSVWTVSTKPFQGAHFAVFPEDLIAPCVLAGSREGDTVLDPFSGAGTTGLVSLRLGRDYVGHELNPQYAQMSRRRIRADAPMFFEEVTEWERA